MTSSIGLNVIQMKGRARLPCGSCLFGLGEAAGMAGAEACPLKRGLLRRLAENRPAGTPGHEVSCDGFTPGFCEAESDAWMAAADLRSQLS
jgi:hypothetical protein